MKGYALVNCVDFSDCPNLNTGIYLEVVLPKMDYKFLDLHFFKTFTFWLQ